MDVPLKIGAIIDYTITNIST